MRASFAKPLKNSFITSPSKEPTLPLMSPLPEEARPAGEVDGDHAEGLVHGQHGVAEPAHALERGQGLPEGLPQGDARVLDGVVGIDLHVALRLYGEVEEAVAREELEHVVEEGDARRDAVAPSPSSFQRDAYLGLLRLPLHLGFPLHDSP